MVETKPKTLFDLIGEWLNPPKKVEEMKDTTGITKSPVVVEAEPEKLEEPVSVNSLRPPYSPEKSRPEKILGNPL